MKLLRTIRFDQSDVQLFPEAADPGEWAVPGTFVFAGANPETLGRQERQAFANGFLGLESFGWSTLVTVAAIERKDYEAAIDSLARYLQQEYGAQDFATAKAAAKEEIDYAASLCSYPVDTILNLERVIEGEAIREQFCIVSSAVEKPHNIMKARR